MSKIPYACKNVAVGIPPKLELLLTTNSTTYIATDMSVDIIVDRSSTLLIILCAGAAVHPEEGKNSRVIVRVLVGKSVISPSDIRLCPDNLDKAGAYTWVWLHQVPAGTHKISIEYRIGPDVVTGRIMDRSLTVLALPA